MMRRSHLWRTTPLNIQVILYNSIIYYIHDSNEWCCTVCIYIHDWHMTCSFCHIHSLNTCKDPLVAGENVTFAVSSRTVMAMSVYTLSNIEDLTPIKYLKM